MNSEEKKGLRAAKRAQITALRIAKAEAWRAKLDAKKIGKKTVQEIETPEETKPIEKTAVKKKLGAKTKKRKKLMVSKKKAQAKEPVKKPIAKPKRRKKAKAIEKKAVLEKEKELLEEILKEPIPPQKTTGEVVEEAIVPNIEEQKKEAEPVEKKTTILSGSFTDISIPHKKDLDLGAGRFKELEEKLKRLRRF